MAFNQSQDTIQTLKLILFLIIIEILVVFASGVVTLANNTEFNAPISDIHLEISDFKWIPYGVKWYGDIPQFIGGHYEAEVDGRTFIVNNVDKGDNEKLQSAIDVYNSENHGNAFDFLGMLAGTLTFSFVPYPFNFVPILFTLIIGFIILYLLFGEVKSWFSLIRG